MKCYTQFIYVISCTLAYGSYDILLVHIYHINAHVLIQSRTWTHTREIIFTKCNHHTIHVGCSLVRKFKVHNKVWIKFSVKSCSCANCWKGLQHPPFRWWWWCLCCWKWHGSFTQLWWITLKLIFSLAEGLHWFSFLLLLCLLLHTWWFIAGLIAWFCSDKLKQTIFIYLWCSTLLSLTDKHQSKKKKPQQQRNHRFLVK